MSVYGKCWTCGADVTRRTRKSPSMDTCVNGHTNVASLTLRGKMVDGVKRLRAERDELLAALRDICAKSAFWADDGGAEDRLCDIDIIARAAIAKAEGEG